MWRIFEKYKKIKLHHGDLLSKDARISAEMEIDSLISQIIGTVDSLLFRIIDKFQLTGIRKKRIEIPTVISGLSAESKGVELAKELQDANLLGNWYWKIEDLIIHWVAHYFRQRLLWTSFHILSKLSFSLRNSSKIS